MNINRTLASVCLALSCAALVTATNVSVGDQPGVVRLSSDEQTFEAPRPVPPADGPAAVNGDGQNGQPPRPDAGQAQQGPSSGAYLQGAPVGQVPAGGPFEMGSPAQAGGPSQFDFTPYMQQSAAATEAPFIGQQMAANPPFGPILMYEMNIDNGLGYADGFHRANARIPYHVVPGNSVLMADLSASITNNQKQVYNFGAIWRNYDPSRNRIFGWNAYFDLDDGFDNRQWKRIGAGVETLGRWIDGRINFYHVTGQESVLLNDSLVGDLVLAGSSVFRTRNQTRDNAYSGVDWEFGGPLPVLGRRGANMFLGGYWLDSDYGNETVGFSARWEVLVTESLNVGATLTTDDNFGTNSWVNLQYEFPSYRRRSVLRPRAVRERLADPVRRSSRIHSNIDVVNVQEAVINQKTGAPYRIAYVDPDAGTGASGQGTLEDPYTSLQVLAANNNAGIDIIRISPRQDDTNTNLTVNGGLDLFDCQVLLSSTKTYTLFSENGMDFNIPGVATGSGLGPLVSNPTMVAGGSVIRIANQNTILGLRIDGADATGTVFGTGITNPLPFTDTNIVMNTFTNYETAVNLMEGSGTIVLDANTADGLAGASNSGLVLTTANGSQTELLVRNNVIDDNATTGIRITAGPNSTINADNPNGVSVAGAVQPTGIFGTDTTDPDTGNTVTGQRVSNGGQGIELIASAGATFNAVVRNNQSTGNTFNGFVARADGGLFNLVSMSGNQFNSNLENGALLHYLNGGMFRSISEDINGNGIIDPGEDINGNGLLDEGIVANTMNDNSVAGLCIFGQGASTGEFDIGGPDANLGNLFSGNTGAGVAVDLQDTATAQIDALFNTVRGGNSGPASLTIVLDFIDATQSPVPTAGLFGFDINTFDVTNYGFAAGDSLLVQNAVLDTVRQHFYGIPTVSQDSRSPIPDGMQLDIDFVLGDAGVPPSNGGTEYYAINIGDSTPADLAAGALGGIALLSGARDANGMGPLPGINNGDFLGNVYANSLTTLQPLNPPNAYTVVPDIIPQPLNEAPDHAVRALTSGNLTFTRRAISLVTAHEIGHMLSLQHIDDTGAVTPTGALPIMGTPAPPFNVPVQQLIDPAEFAFSGIHLPEFPGDTQFVQNSIAQLASAVGLRVAAGESRNGFTINAVDNSRLLSSSFNNNNITGAQEHGINVEVHDNAVAEGVTIQSNSITGGAGHGVRLHADGAGAIINADNTIGGSGTNTYRGATFAQGNTITGNSGDGFRALASNGGTIFGNLINNDINSNGRNGASLYVENGGTIDFGTTSNRIISGNNLSDNGAAGLELISNVSATTVGQIDAVVRNNTISRNGTGGILSSMSGPNMGGATNNVINLTVGGTSAQSNTVDANAGVGIGFSTAGNGKGNLDLRNSTVSGTTGTPGHGIFLQRQDASLLTAVIDTVTSTGNSGDGLSVDVQGNDRFDINQPMSGTINSVVWNNNNFSSNGNNGATFRVRGDAQLLADASNNTLTNNTNHGLQVFTSQNSSFGDPTDGLPPGRRTLISGTTATGNGLDGMNFTATDNSRVLAEITSIRTAGGSGAHAGLNTNGDTNISNNGRDGIRINTTGGTSDILITSSTGNTTISGNGTNGGGNGIRWDASGSSDGTVRVTRTTITGNIAGAVEDPALNNNGVLDPGEDVNRNGILDGSEDDNSDVDTEDGDGIQYNVFGNATSTLIVGGIGDGNVIQNNQDDGIAITTTGSGTSVSRPIISIVGNTIGGERNGVPAGNQGDGLSFNHFGGTSTANNAGNQGGPVAQMTVADNTVKNNGRRGANLLLHGSGGDRDRENGNSTFDPIRITMTGNTFSSNGTEGVLYRGDSNMNQSRTVLLSNQVFDFDGDNDRDQIQPAYHPSLPNFQNLNIGSVAGKSAFAGVAPDGDLAYLNLRTVQNAFLTITGNSIQNNGVGTVSGEGLIIQVGTGSYLAADVRTNTFGGNLDADMRTESFLSAGNTQTSIDTMGMNTFDTIFLDDSAQLDMRFTGNSGNQIETTSTGATYTNFDLLKSVGMGGGSTSRLAAFFQIDDQPNLDNPNNAFIGFGTTQDIDATFGAGGFNLRGAADPLFPNIEFAPFLP